MIRVDSPSKRYPGYVLLPDSLTFPQSLAWEDATNSLNQDDKPFMKTWKFLPGVLACVAEWHINGFPTPLAQDNFPSSPATAVMRIITAIVGAITKLQYEDDEAKNE